MANTEGISDEHMFKLLSLDGDSRRKTSFSRGLLQRQRMMDEFELDGHSQPSAKVVRASKPPSVKSSNPLNKDTLLNMDGNNMDHSKVGSKIEDDVQMKDKVPYKPIRSSVLKSNVIIERQINLNSEGDLPKKKSLFKLKRQQEAATDVPASKAGFPSFDFPIGSMTRKSTGMASVASSKSVNNSDKAGTEPLSDADIMIAGMSSEDIQESIAEIKSVLSKETIAFLKNRKKKQNDTKTDQSKHKSESSRITFHSSANRSEVDLELNENDKKRYVSDMLSNVTTEDELDEIYEKITGFATENMNYTTSESELESAAKLLRSTSTRQRLLGSKTVYSLLRNRYLEIAKEGLDFPVEKQSCYPILLPIALRCLLDVPYTHKNMELITYALQSISVLTLLFSDPYHRIDCHRLVELSEIEPSLIYQCDYMQDDVPIPSASVLFAENEETNIEKNDIGNGLYATNATSTTADTDAVSFYKDPSWTLLSKMRIIPCVSQILGTLKKLPFEAIYELKFCLEDFFTSICSILSVLSLRSPGAAVAIGQHKIIVPTLSDIGLTPGADENVCVNTTLALPLIYFLSVLSRQSRVAAYAIAFVLQDVVCILTISPESKNEIELKRWCIILWRTLLHYGIGISHLSTVLQISIPCLSSSTSDNVSLASEYLSAYAVICQHVRSISYYRALDMSSDRVIENAKDRESLLLSGMWFSAHAQSCCNTLSMSSSGTLKLMASMLQFLSMYFAASSPKDMNRTTSIDPARYVPVVSLDHFLRVLNEVLDSDLFSDAIRFIFDDQNQNHKLNASACAYVEAFMNAFDIVSEKVDLITSSTEDSKTGEDHETLITELEQKLLKCMRCNFYTLISKNKNALELKVKHFIPRSRWTVSAQSAVIKFLCSSIPLIVNGYKDKNIEHVYGIQSAAIEILGKFQLGQEAAAVLLLNQDSIFTILDENNLPFQKASPTSAIQNIIINQLYSTQKCKEQLIHSFKLKGRPGILLDNNVFSNLESLRQDVDGISYIVSDHLELPLGEQWIWKFLSSLSSTTNLTDDTANDVIRAMIETIKYLNYAEKVHMPLLKSVSAGNKLYFLLNCLLSPESVLRNDVIQSSFVELLLVYSRQFFNTETICGKDFIIACCTHSKNFAEKFKEDQFDDILELFFRDKNLSSNELELSSKDLKAVDEFICDISNAFTEYGAQYDFFIQSIRILLAPGMSVRVRNRLVENLKDVPHLLTTQAESSDETNALLKETLSLYLRGGHRVYDNSPREHAMYLDTLIRVLSKQDTFYGKRSGFFYYMAVGTIARELAAFAIKCACGTSSMKQKLSNIDRLIWSDISRVAIECARLKCADSVELAKVVIDCCSMHHTEVNECYEFDAVIKTITSNEMI